MATAIVSTPKPHKWFSPKNYFKSKSKSKSNVQNTPVATSPPPTPEVYRRVFSRFDTNGDGKISAEELRSYFASIGEAMSSDEARSVVSDFDDESLDFECFLKLIERSDDDKNDDLKMAFEMFEEGSSGFITPKGLQKMLSRLGDSRSHQDCVSMIRAFDLDGNGVLDFHEFLHMMTSN